MVRTADAKFGFWLAGYYEDFIGSRCVADDANQPSSDFTYTDSNSHHGNTINGEATLNPRFRWSVRDRTTSGEVTSTSNYLLVNEGIARWATFDATRLGKGSNWAGRAQLQYPSSWAHPNRLRYDKAGNNNADDAYIRFTSSSDTSMHYFVPGGDTDATFGRETMLSYNANNWSDADAGYISTGTAPDFMQSAHLTGVWAGERAQTVSTHANHPERIFRPIKSKAGKPFLCIRTYMNENNDHRVNNVAPSGNNRPVISYHNNLNSRADGDVFTIRMAVHSHNANPDPGNPIVTANNVDTSVPVEYTLRVGFPAATAFKETTGSDNAAAAISWTFRPGDGHGLSTTESYYSMLYDASESAAEAEPWFDLDFVIDYTNNKFKVYHEGTEVTATNDGAGGYSSGYTLAGSPNAKDMTGWELFVTNHDSGTNTFNKKAIMTTMIDRVAVCRPLTDRVDNTDPASVSAWSANYPVNGVSMGSITILDDDTEQNLTPFFTDDAVIDWRLLLFSGNIHRPLWSGLIESVTVKQSAKEQTREVQIQARDSLSLLDRQIAAWEIGQIGAGEDDVVLSRQEEVSILHDAMFMGTRRLEQRLPTLGFEKTDYTEKQNQRMSIGSGHPIQVYNNEDTDGPNSVEEDWLGYRIIGFNETTGGAVEAVIYGDLPTATQVGDTITVFGSDNYSANYTLGIGEASDATNSLGGVPTTYDLQELPGASWTANSSAAIYQLSGVGATPTAAPNAVTDRVHITFTAIPTHSDGTEMTTGDYIMITEKENATASPSPGASGLFRVLSITASGGYYVVRTDRTNTFANQTKAYSFSIDGGYFKPTDESINYRNAHALWMRDLPKSPWFRKHFGIFSFAPLELGSEILANFNADTTSIKCSVDLFQNNAARMSGVGQIRDTDGFIDTFTYTGIIHKSAASATYIVGVKGLSRNHTTSSTVYLLGTEEDYKHTWLLWSDMRNNGDADADGGERKNEFGLLQPVTENYELGIAFKDQFNTDGSYAEFTDLKIGEDVELWEIDAAVDPSTNAPWSLPLLQGAYDGTTHGAMTRGITTGKTSGYLTATTATFNNLAVGDKVLIFDDPFTSAYNTHHTITAITGSGGTRTFEFSGTPAVHTSNYSFGSTDGNGPYMAKVDDAYTVHTDLATWEDKAGAFLAVDASPFFNLNTFANGGRYGQTAGGRTTIGEYTTEYHGFPILMDSYWSEAAAKESTVAQPYDTHKNYRKWNQEVAELNRSILLGDTVIETKPSVTDLSLFPSEGFGKIRATRAKTSTNPSTEILYYTFDGKLDSASTGTATGSTSTTITDTSATFVDDGVEVGMRVRNVTAKWVAQISAVTNTQITFTATSQFQETGSSRTTTNVGDSISVPQQLFGVYLEPDGGRTLTAQQAETYLSGVLLDTTKKANGAAVKVELSSNNANTSGTFDEVKIGASVSPRYALRFLMNMNGFVESENSGTYYMNDKVRFMWSLMLSDTWLTQAMVPCWFDFSTVPQSDGMTTDGTNGNFDSFGSVNDARGGKSILSILRDANESVGVGSGGKSLASTYQMGRDNALEVRPAYNSGEAVNRNNLQVSQMNAAMTGQITNVRVYYNNGASFVDHPEPTLGGTYRWKIVEMPEVRSKIEAEYAAKETFRKSKTKAVTVMGDIIRDLDDTDKMLNGRYGYIADVSREIERGVTQNALISGGRPAPSNAFNSVWSSASAGNMFPGMVNALDGNLGTDGTDPFLRTRYGKGFIAASSSSNGATETYNNNYWWWGANSISHAVQMVHVPTGTPLVSSTTGNELRVFVALKDGQSGTDIDNAEFTVGFSDVTFNTGAQTPFTGLLGPVSYAPSLAATLATNGFQSVNVSKNGFYEVTIPTSYGAPASSKFVISVNVDYLRDLLRHRCGNPAGSGILHNAHNITELGPSAWSATSADSIFPLGARQYADLSGAFDTRYAWYAPRLHVVEDLRWRPGTQVTYTDSGLGLSSEPMVINRIAWSVKGRDVEKLSLTLERDQSKDPGGLASYLFPSISRRRGGYPTAAPGGGGGSDTPYFPPQLPGAGQGHGFPGGTPYQPGGGSLGGSGITPRAIEGGHGQIGRGSGAFTRNYGANALSSSVNNSLRGRLNLGDGGLSSASFSVLGQNRTLAPINTQRSLDSLDSTISPASAGATQTEEGWVFPGIVDPETSNRFTHTQTMNLRVPEDVADEIVTVGGTYSLGGNATDTAVLTVTVTCDETGASESRTINLSGNADRQPLFLLGSPINGLSSAGNNVRVEFKRTPGNGDDDMSYSSLVLHNIRVNFQRFSIMGRDNAEAFSPY